LEKLKTKEACNTLSTNFWKRGRKKPIAFGIGIENFSTGQTNWLSINDGENMRSAAFIMHFLNQESVKEKAKKSKAKKISPNPMISGKVIDITEYVKNILNGYFEPYEQEVEESERNGNKKDHANIKALKQIRKETRNDMDKIGIIIFYMPDMAEKLWNNEERGEDEADNSLRQKLQAQRKKQKKEE